MSHRFIGLLTLAAAFTGSCGVASAQIPPPPYAGTVIASREVQGTVQSFGGYRMAIRARGDLIPVDLHRGTIIRPIGLTLEPGMYVRVGGYWSNGTFIADRIALLR